MTQASRCAPPARDKLPDGACRIREAAQRLFAASGLDGVSMQRVADAAGVSKANVFHHFASKEALYRAVLEDATTDFLELLAGLDNDHSTESLATFARRNQARLAGELQTSRLFLHALAAPQPSEQRRLAEETAARTLDKVIGIFERRRERGDLPRDCDCAVLAVTLLGGQLLYAQLHNVIRRLESPGGLLTHERYAETVTRMLTATPGAS